MSAPSTFRCAASSTLLRAVPVAVASLRRPSSRSANGTRSLSWAALPALSAQAVGSTIGAWVSRIPCQKDWSSALLSETCSAATKSANRTDGAS